jgi:hypothetical protein
MTHRWRNAPDRRIFADCTWRHGARNLVQPPVVSAGNRVRARGQQIRQHAHFAHGGGRVRTWPGIAPASGIGDPARAVRPSRLLTGAGRQAWPLRPVRPALGRGRWHPNRGPYGLVRPAGRPCGTAGRPVVTGGTGFSSRNPPRRCRMVTLAGWARQPAQSVRRPARGNRPGPVVRLPERGRIRESGLAPRHGAPGRRNQDLVTNDTTPGDRNLVNQRIERHRRLRGFAITVSRDAEGRRLSSAASPPGHARPPGVPGKTS